MSNRHTGDGAITHQWNHVVAVPAQHHGGDVLDRETRFQGHESPETCRIQDSRHSDDAVLGKAGDLLHHIHHCVQWVGDDDHEGIGRQVANLLGNALHDTGILVDKIVSAHSRTSWQTRRHDDDIGIGGRFIVIRTGEIDVVSVHGTRCQQIQRLALRDTLSDIDQDHIAKFLHGGQVCQCSTYGACANQ